MNSHALTDERLMALAKGGDEQAFQSLIRRRAPDILTYAKRVHKDTSAAEEVFADVVVKVWTARHSYHVGRPLRPWLMAITANASREWFRKRPSFSELHDVEDGSRRAAHGDAKRETSLELDERTAALEPAIGRLPLRQREVLVLRVWGELSYEHIAQALDLEEVTVRSHIHNALAALRRALGGRFGVSGRSEADSALPGEAVRRSAER